MASINLAGAIGLGGKRESIISGLPDAINKAGDALNKTIGDELRRQEAERAAKKEKELQLNEMFQKQIKTLIPKDDLHPNDYAELDSEKGKIFAEGFRINSDPTKSYAQKAIELEDLALKFGEKANYAKQSWDSFSKQQEEKNNPIYDMSIVDKMLQGNYGTQQETVVTDNQTSPERKSYNMSPSVQAENEFANADEMQSAYNREQPQTITTPQKPSIQGKPFFDIPLEQRMKELPVPKQEFANRIKFNQADEKKAFEEFAGVPLGAFTQKLNIDGKDKIVFQQEKFDFEEKALEAALADPSGEGLGKEMRILRATLSTNYFKDLVDKNNIPVEKAQVIAFNYANEVIKDKFKKSVEAAKLDRIKDLDLTAGKSGDGSSVSGNTRMEEARGVVPSQKSTSIKLANEIREKATAIETNLKRRKGEMEIAVAKSKLPMTKETIANFERQQKAANLINQSADVIENTQNVKDYVLFSQQLNSDDKELTLTNDNNNPTSIKPLLVFEDNKGNLRLGGVQKTTEVDKDGNKVTKEVAVDVPLSDGNFKTMKINKKGFDTEFEKTKFAKKRLSSPKEETKKLEAPKKAEAKKENLRKKYNY